jgi:hypothetical protein
MSRIGLILLAVFLGCGPSTTKQQPPKTPPKQPPVSVEHTGQIMFECKPAEALVNVDGDDRGTAARIAEAGGLTLPHGLHRIEITHPGFRPFRFELILGDKPETLKVELQPVGQTPR